jgi:hypothetical protein
MRTMGGTWRIVAALTGLGLTAAAACSSSSPNQIPGQCVLSGGTWYCGAGYGNYPDCTATSGPCTPGAATCFTCALEPPAGESCSCVSNDGAPGSSWECLGTETGCKTE